MDNAEAIPRAAGESVEIIRRRSDRSGQPHAGCEDARQPASNSVVNTPHESLFHQALIRARLSFETQSHPDGDRWEADIQLHQAPVIIEVTNSPGQTRNADRYRRKTEAFEAAGYRVYWFSNYQARTDPDACVRKVMEENGLEPEADPVALIRANRIGQVGRHNPNWGGGAQTVTCEQCGSGFESYRRSARAKGTGRFCSQECYGQWMHEHPDAVKSRRLEMDWSDLGKLYESGMSTYQLAEHYGCSRTAVKAAMRKNGIALRPQGGYRPKGGFLRSGEGPC